MLRGILEEQTVIVCALHVTSSNPEQYLLHVDSCIRCIFLHMRPLSCFSVRGELLACRAVISQAFRSLLKAAPAFPSAAAESESSYNKSVVWQALE